VFSALRSGKSKLHGKKSATTVLGKKSGKILKTNNHMNSPEWWGALDFERFTKNTMKN